MSLGLVGRKVGMTRIFKDDGTSVPVTVLDCCRQPRHPDQDRRKPTATCAVQVAFGKRRATRVTKAMAGHFAKAGVEAGTELSEFRVDRRQASASSRPGAELKVDMFQVGQKVDVSGTTHRQGLRRRHQAPPLLVEPRLARQLAVAQQRRARSAWRRTRAACFPASMAGHLGNVKRTVQLLEIVRVDAERSLLMVKGSVPGAKNGAVDRAPEREGRRQGRREGRQVMELKVINEKGEAQKSVDASETALRARLQRGAGAPGRRRVPAPTAARARARRRRAAKCATRPRSRGARRAPAARAPA